MSEKIEISKHIIGDKVEIYFKGIIDEDIDFSDITGLKAKSYVFDFDEVKMINSCGIREWIKYIDSLPEKSKILYKNCPQIIIEQINMVHGFIREGAQIESFYAPYYCESCGKESKIHIQSSVVKGTQAPKFPCPYCQSDQLEFDAIEAQYFSFLKNLKP